MKVSTVIVIFCYNRLAHLKKTLKSLKKITIIQNIKYIFFLMVQKMRLIKKNLQIKKIY